MKRRDFIVGATSSAGILLLEGAKAATPCAPVLAGSGPSAACVAGDLEADWLARKSAPGVVWFHDFSSAAEVDAFRWAGGFGNDPSDVHRPGRCIHNTTDGITGGGCLELIYPVGSSGAPGWWRPFAPMNGISNGRGENDPGANGSMPLKPWDPSNKGENEAFREAYYAHPSYIGAAGFDASKFDGSEFWLQFRIKMDANRYQPGTPTEGKQSFLATTQQTLNQEIVSMNRFNRAAMWYTYFGSSPDTGGAMGVYTGTKQPGSAYSCYAGSPCWEYENNQWVTWLYHLVPGVHDTKTTLFEAFVARPGQTSYETIFTQLNTIRYSNTANGHPYGYNSFQPSNYMNNQSSSVQWYQRYDQIVFSRDFIPCPQV